MKMLKIAMDFTSLHPVSKLNSQGRVKFSLFRYGSQRGLAFSKAFEEELKKLADVLVDGYG
jgi:hypothetical protein